MPTQPPPAHTTHLATYAWLRRAGLLPGAYIPTHLLREAWGLATGRDPRYLRPIDIGSMESVRIIKEAPGGAILSEPPPRLEERHWVDYENTIARADGKP